MGLRRSSRVEGTVHAQNIGGIEETTVEFSPGVTVLVGRNATNRTSLLQAVMAGIGSDNVSMKGDADEAAVELTLGDKTYTRRLVRQADGVATAGEPYLDDPTLADLFAFLLGSNEARRAVARGDDLRDLIMRPVDTEEIQAEIAQLGRERRELEGELEEIDGLKGDLPGLEERRAQLQRQIEEKEAELAATEEALEAADADIEKPREEESELDDKLEALRSKRADLDDVRYELDTERESLEAVERERRELEAERDDLREVPEGRIDEIESQISRLRERKRGLETEVNQLQSAIGFNAEMLEESAPGVFGVRRENSSGDVTERLLGDEEVVCWTCGSEVDRDQIEATVARLRELSGTTIGEVEEIEEEINDLIAEQQELQRALRERERVERRLSALDEEREAGEENVVRLREQREVLAGEIESIEAEVEKLEVEDYTEVLELHREANRIEFDLGKLENELGRVEDQTSGIEARIGERADVEARLAKLRAKIEDLRTRIERIEAEAVEQFNEHMDAVLKALDYTNLDRIWLERVEREANEGRRKVTKGAFELHVVRTSASGTTYEDTIDHLSESEREVAGLVLALAGYLAHEVYETVPFMLLDSLEAIDAERIAALIEYLDEYTSYLLVALLPEDAASLPNGYERVSDI